jgi:DNA polymerase-4
LSIETTFNHNLRDEAALTDALAPLALELAARVDRAGFPCRTLTLKVRYHDFAIVSRRMTRALPFVDAETILAAACELLAQRPRQAESIRLLGLGVSSPTDDGEQRQLGLPLRAAGTAGR